jgi:chorismate-pyruvate lyase
VLQLATITAPFFPNLTDLGEFARVEVAEMPPDYQRLLAHDEHMTVTVEEFHGSVVDVRVLQQYREDDVYSRCSLLVCRSTGRAVQLGVMRINLHGLSAGVRDEIESCKTPLGRILIRHNVLRRVELQRLWRIAPGPQLRANLALPSGPGDAGPIYGRSAGILVEGRAAVELLEIVTL